MSRSYLKDAAKRRAARTGCSYQNALQALTRFDTPRPDQPVTPPGIDWSPLYGVDVTIQNDHARLRGVVLPPDDVRPGDQWLRIAVTEPHTGITPAEVTYLRTDAWRIDPMPDTVDRRYLPSRRRTRGPAGLPLYRDDTLPAAALATRTMLQRQYRMRVAADQQPVAEYFTGRDYVDLYAIDDAERMPEQSPARKAAWHKNRTCARCGLQNTEPFAKSEDGQRYCWPCTPFAVDEWWTTHFARAQSAASEWAREILGDPDAVLTASGGWPFVRVVALNVSTGAAEHDLTTNLQRPDPDGIDPWYVEDNDPRWKTSLWLSEVAEIMTVLSRRRFISWTTTLEPIARRLIEARHLTRPADGGLDSSAWAHTKDDSLWRWHHLWLSEPEYPLPSGKFRWSGTTNQAVTLRGLRHERSASRDNTDGLLEQGLRDLALLREMAAGAPTEEHRRRAREQGGYFSQMYVYASTLAEFAAPRKTGAQARNDAQQQLHAPSEKGQ